MGGPGRQCGPRQRQDWIRPRRCGVALILIRRIMLEFTVALLLFILVLPIFFLSVLLRRRPGKCSAPSPWLASLKGGCQRTVAQRILPASSEPRGMQVH